MKRSSRSILVTMLSFAVASAWIACAASVSPVKAHSVVKPTSKAPKRSPTARTAIGRHHHVVPHSPLPPQEIITQFPWELAMEYGPGTYFCVREDPQPICHPPKTSPLLSGLLYTPFPKVACLPWYQCLYDD